VVLTGRKLFIIFSVWLAVILIRMVWLAGDFSSWRRIETETIAGRTGTLPALRGTICDSSGNRLAWSEKYYDLVFSGTLWKEEVEELRSLLPDRQIPADYPHGFTIYKLTPNEMLALDRAVKRMPSLQIRSRVERVIVNGTGLKELIGELDPATGRGISGWEKEFDKQLAGSDGSFRVLLDRNGRWIENTWEIREMPRRGNDVQVDTVSGRKPQ
jgi:cell division protein FtsI/penicillin-binding protein 2